MFRFKCTWTPPHKGPSSKIDFTVCQATYRAQNNLPESKGPLMCFIGRRFGGVFWGVWAARGRGFRDKRARVGGGGPF